LSFCVPFAEPHTFPDRLRVVPGCAGLDSSSAGSLRHLRAHVRRRAAQQRTHAAPQRDRRGGADATGLRVLARRRARRQNGGNRGHLVSRLLDALLRGAAGWPLGPGAARPGGAQRRAFQRRRHTLCLRLQVLYFK